MSRGVSIQVEGLEALKKKLGAIPENVIIEVDADMSAVARNYVNRAQDDAPQFNRALANSITDKKNAVMDYEVVSPMPYSAYVEFGTKSRFKAIPGIDSSKFKGKTGGGVIALYNNILDWVKKKGIASRWSVKTHKPMKANKQDTVNIQEAASAITISILRHGIHPHPFFFKQMPIAQEELNKATIEAVKRALSK